MFKGVESGREDDSGGKAVGRIEVMVYVRVVYDTDSAGVR